MTVSTEEQACTASKARYVHNKDLGQVTQCVTETLRPIVDLTSQRLQGAEGGAAQASSAGGGDGGDEEEAEESMGLKMKFEETVVRTKDEGGATKEEVVPVWTLLATEEDEGASQPWHIRIRVFKVPPFDKANNNGGGVNCDLINDMGGGEGQASPYNPSGGFPPKHWNGHMLEMKLFTTLLHPNQHGKAACELQAHQNAQLKKAFTRLWYRLIGQLIRHCEWPEFPGNRHKFKDVYQLNEEIKSGSYGAVCKGKHRTTGEPYAIKIIARGRLSPAEEIDILTEVSVLSSVCHHPGIVRLEDFYEQERYFILIMELCEGGDLFDRIGANREKPYTERDARDLCKMLLEAIRYCHEEEGVAHCDLKPKNLLLQSVESDASVKLADFGFASRVIYPESLTKQCGTPFFVAPEILKKLPYDQRADMWSLGVIIFCLLSGTMPFLGKTRRELFTAIVEGKYEFKDEYWAHVSEGAKELIRGLLLVEPNERLTAGEALQSQWIKHADRHTLSENDLSKTSKELRTFNARMKLKAAIIGVVLVTRTGYFSAKAAKRCTLHGKKNCSDCSTQSDTETEAETEPSDEFLHSQMVMNED